MSRTAALLITLSALAAHAQSIDCKLASSPREQAICSSTQLSALDTQLTAAYKGLRAQLSPAGAALVESDQQEWLQWVGLICPAHGKGIADDQARCLQNEYTNRVHDLQQTAHIGNALIFPRAHFLYRSGESTDKNAVPNDPGFGYGSLRWPQIDIPVDQPNPAYAAFNAALKAKAEKLAVGFTQDKNATFETAVDSSGTIEAYFNIHAANERLIDVGLIDGTYGWGAAHPLTDQRGFVWFLDRGRELAAADVFLPGSGWEDTLASLAMANLRSQPDLKDALFDNIDQPVHDAATDPTSWSLTRDGLTITFGQYAIGPYALGMPSAHVRWSAIRPWLNPGLEPARLPAPVKKTE